MFFDTKHDNLLALINRIARVKVQVKAPIEVKELRLARSDCGLPIHHLVVVLYRAALIRWVGGIRPNYHVDVGLPLCILGYR